ILTDRTNTIRASVDDVQMELLITIALVVAVIFIFLRELRATIIPSVAVPLSLVGTFGVMYLLGYSLNNLTLMALTISTGSLVSAVVSLTLTPMMCAKLLRHEQAAAHGWFYRTSERAFQWTIDLYGRTLQVVLRHQFATLVVAIATLALTVVLYVYIPKGFFP